jgi:3-deoxy-D-manno-octulosonic acid kinase
MMGVAFDPPGYVSLRIGGARIVVREADATFVRDALAEAGSLYSYAARHPDAQQMRGRQTLYVIPGPRAARWVVRRLSHGGLLAPVTGDRFLRACGLRPLRELRLAHELAALGIPTPPVAAAVVYPRGPLYRGEIAREEITGALDLGACLYGKARLAEPGRRAALAAAGRLVRSLHEAGLLHPDLNLRNILVQSPGAAPRAYILDIEKCRRVARLRAPSRKRMLHRLRRSARRFEERTGQRLSPEEWEEFRQAYGGQ